jgi:hypothetical protein
MKLTSITFTGIDERTDIDRVREISEKYPYVEWGVLLSYHWQENGNRYPNPALLEKLEYGGLRLSAHLCGQMARDVADGETRKMYETINWNFDIFRRCQLNTNVSARYQELRSMRPFDRMLNEVILQMNGGDSLDSFLRYCEKPLFHVAYLLDASGGRGINTPIRVFDNKDIHIGYAGGINPENVGAKLKQLLDFYSYGSFWIDMESGVRTEDDWLDLDKVQQVLDVCAPLIAEHDRHRQP